MSFNIEIKSGSKNNHHHVRVLSGASVIGEFLLRGTKVSAACVADPKRLPRFKQAALSIIEMGACGGRFDF